MRITLKLCFSRIGKELSCFVLLLKDDLKWMLKLRIREQVLTMVLLNTLGYKLKKITLETVGYYFLKAFV